MQHDERMMARRQIDERLKNLGAAEGLVRPPRGWVKAIREALGITTRQLAGRIGVAQSRVVAMEKAEGTGSITINSLERAAHALDCRLVYVLAPRIPLEQMVEEKALALARERLARTEHSMALEGQRVTYRENEARIRDLARKLSETAGSKLWETK